MRAHRIVSAVILATIALAIFQTDASSQEQFWLNLPSSPLKIERTPNGRFMTLSNYSSKKAIKYRLGCLVKTDDGVKIVGTRKGHVITLEPIDAATNLVSFIPLDLNANDVKKCSDKGAKVAVVEVTFADDSTWRAVR